MRQFNSSSSKRKEHFGRYSAVTQPSGRAHLIKDPLHSAAPQIPSPIHITQQLLHYDPLYPPGTGAAPLNPEQKRALTTSTIIDTALGLVAGGLLLTHRERLQALAAEGSERLVDGFLAPGTEWLMSVAPAGLKLNEELDVFMGRAVLRILKVSKLGE